MYRGEYIVFDGDGEVRPFVYFVVQKTGCSSVKRALAPLFGLDVPDNPTEVARVMAVHDAFGLSPHQIPHAELLRRLRGGRLEEHLLFAFVRHPLDRLVSCYLQKLANDDAQGLNRYEFAGQKLRKGMPFAEFARAVCRVPDARADAHFRSQHLTTHDGRGRLLADHVGRFENLAGDFAEVARKLGLPAGLPHLFRSNNRGNHAAYYDAETRRMVERRYARDLALFGYESRARETG